MGVSLHVLLAASLIGAVSCFNAIERDAKLSIFQVVKFTNNMCTGASRNGTCFTQVECDNMDGTKDGTCADGFGVCCIITLSSGGSSSVNNTYIVHTSTTSFASGTHQYTICPCGDDICRMKFDFTTFDLAGPVTGIGTVATITDDNGLLNLADSIGDCVIDTFSITSPSGRSTPIICGTNTNQHMIVDASGSECIIVNVGIGGTISTGLRQLDIRATQYRCGDEQGGPSGCLQYFDSLAGRIRSFNFPDVSNGAVLAYNYVHISRQHYKTCIRRGLGKQYVCYTPCTDHVGASAAPAVTNQPSFGLSISPNAAGQSEIGTNCNTDYITIPGGVSAAIVAILSTAGNAAYIPNAGTVPNGRHCGRYLATNAAVFAAQSICTTHVPFEVSVDFDDGEVCSAITNSILCEFKNADSNLGGGGGILGFSLCYQQT